MAFERYNTLITDHVVDTTGLKKGQTAYSRYTQKVTADTKKADKATASYSAGIGRLGTSFVGAGVGAYALVAAISAVTSGLSAMAAEYAEFERFGLVTEQLQKTTGNYGQSVQDLTYFTKLNARATLASREEYGQAMNILQTFTAVTDHFNRALAVSQDMATLPGMGQLRDNVKLLGKVLQDPVANMGALSRNGVSFDKTTQDIIKTLHRQNRTFEAQDLILKEIEKQVGGAGIAAAQGLAGAVDTLAENWSELNDEVGKYLDKEGAVTNFTKTLGDMVRIQARSVADARRLATGKEDRGILEQLDDARFDLEQFRSNADKTGRGFLPDWLNWSGAIQENNLALREARVEHLKSDAALVEMAKRHSNERKSIKKSQEEALAELDKQYKADAYSRQAKQAQDILTAINADYEARVAAANSYQEEVTALNEMFAEKQKEHGIAVFGKLEENIAYYDELYEIQAEAQAERERLQAEHYSRLQEATNDHMAKVTADWRKQNQDQLNIQTAFGIEGLFQKKEWSDQDTAIGIQNFKANQAIWGDIIDDQRERSKEGFNIWKFAKISEGLISVASATLSAWETGMKLPGAPATAIAMATMAASAGGVMLGQIAATDYQGKKMGGPTPAGQLVRFGEGGQNEMFEQGGKHFFLPGERGSVSPMPAVSAGMPNIIVNNYTKEPVQAENMGFDDEGNLIVKLSKAVDRHQAAEFRAGRSQLYGAVKEGQQRGF